MDNLEELRKANIQRNTRHLGELGILLKPFQTHPRSGESRLSINRPPPPKRRKLEPLQPSRSSARIASAPTRPTYNEDEKQEVRVQRSGKASSAVAKKTKHGGTTAAAKHTEATEGGDQKEASRIPLKDIEALRTSWTSWSPTAPPPTRDEDSTLHFSEHATFTPNKTPEEMLREGCFGGSYFRPLYSRALGTTIADDYFELPPSWIAGLDAARFLTSPDYDPEVNKYKVRCGQSIEEWEAAGWIAHEYDVRGWFQWYCRFFQGRRCEDDERQVGRWRKCVGETGRWRRMLLKKYRGMGVREVFDDGEDDERGDVSPVMHQTCFHWAYEVRQQDLDRFWDTGT